MSGLGSLSLADLPQDMSQWPKLPPKKLLAKFHAKFWGTSMVREEEEWCRTQSSNVEPGDGNEDQVFLVIVSIHALYPTEGYIGRGNGYRRTCR